MVNSSSDDDSAARLADVTAFLTERGVVATAREFRLRQEFTRYGWDVRVRADQGIWSVTAEKSGRGRVAEQGTTEANALRLALAAALRADDEFGSA